MRETRPDRPDLQDALVHLSRITEPSAAIRYTEMWLREAAAATTHDEEAGHLAKAEQQLGRALLASAAPSNELSLAYSLIQRARSEATD